jgi:hypothetical protein
MTQGSSRSTLQLQAPPALTAAVKLAAEREMTTISEFVRRVLIDRLRSDGLDPLEHSLDRQGGLNKSGTAGGAEVHL